jgi:hypothetical protein
MINITVDCGNQLRHGAYVFEQVVQYINQLSAGIFSVICVGMLLDLMNQWGCLPSSVRLLGSPVQGGTHPKPRTDFNGTYVADDWRIPS